MNNPMHPSQDTRPFSSEVEFARYAKDTGLLAPSPGMQPYLTPVAVFTLAVAIIVSSMPPAIVQYLVFAIMFSAPAVGVVAFFAQNVGASAQCYADWTPVVQTSERFVVRGGGIPFAAIEPFTSLHFALLVAALASLAVLWRLVGRFVNQAADDHLTAPSTPPTLGLGHDNRMFTIIYPRTVRDPRCRGGYRTAESFRDRQQDLWSVLLDASGYQPYCVNIDSTVFLRGTAYRWNFYPQAVRNSLRAYKEKMARRRGLPPTHPFRSCNLRVRGSDWADISHDYITLQYGAWVPVDPKSDAPPLVNVEAVHQALLLQAILEAPHQTDHARDKVPGRTALLHAWLEQALIPGFDVINTHVLEVAVDHPPHEGDPASFGEAAHNFYYYRTSVGGPGMDDLPDRSPPLDNDTSSRSVSGVPWHTYIGDNSLDDDRSNLVQPNLATIGTRVSLRQSVQR
jgi:hypothetical protein